MPFSRSKGVAIESAKYGNVLWTPTDSGRTRIGFVCPEEIKDDQCTASIEAAIIAAAAEAVQPFKLEFDKLEWWTIYSIGQRVAETFRKGDVFLIGDAAHTHSSGAAQVYSSHPFFISSSFDY
jgi:phenol 2-monooxygenase